MDIDIARILRCKFTRILGGDLHWFCFLFSSKADFRVQMYDDFRCDFNFFIIFSPFLLMDFKALI